MATTRIQSGGVTDQSITHDKLHTDMNLSTKTVVLPSLSQTLVNSSHLQLGGNLDVVGQIGAYDNPGTAWGKMILRATDFELKNAGGTIKLTLDTSGNVYIKGVDNITTTAGNTNLQVLTTNSQGADLGGSIGMGGVYHATNQITFAEIHGKKENSTTADLKGYMSFVTRDSGGSTEKMRITPGGALGLGVIPGVWSSNYPALHVGQGATFTGHRSNTQTQLGQNWWIGTGNQYIVDGAAARLIMNPDSTIIFSQAPSGLANATMSTTHNRLVIKPDGNVGIGTDAPLAKLHVQGNAVIGDIQPYETTNPANSGATLHVHNLADDGGTNDGKVTFGDETQVIISTGAIDGGPQGYQGSLWFGTSDHPAGGNTLNSVGTQWNWKVAGIASKTDQDTGSQNQSYGNLEFYTKGANNVSYASLAMTIDESQNVGIGTTPASGRKLDVAGAIATTGIIHQDAGSTGSVALGFEALNGNVSGNWSVAIGRQALDAALTGDFNVAIGRTSMTNMVSGTQNVALGVDSMEEKTAGSYNVAIGASALRVNALIGDQNTALGAQAGRNVRGSNNTLIGHEAGYDITTANNNTYVGRFQGTQHSHSIADEGNNVVLSDGLGHITYRSNTSSLQGTSGTRTHHFATAYEDTTSSGWVAGAAANTWHRITDINFNLAPWQTSLIPLMRIGLTFASLNPTYGYVGKAYIDVMNTGANTGYTGNSNFQTMSNGVVGYELPVNIATHTGTTTLEFRARMVLTGTQKNLEVYSNIAQNSGYPVTMTIQLFHSLTN